MNQLSKVLFLCVIITLPIYANPVAVGIPFFEPLLQFFLFGEALVISLMLTNHKFYLIRTLISWQIVTSLTFILFSLLLVIMIEIHPAVFLLSIIPLEYLVVSFEARVIQKFSRKKFFNREPKEMSYKEAFKISLIGNLVSIYMGLIGLLKQFI